MNAPSPTDTDHRTAILDAAVRSFGKLGYYDTSSQRIATGMGLTKAGMPHYAGSKEGLLKLALTEEYDRVTGSINAAAVAQERPLIAGMWRQVVAVNNKRPALTYMFSTLSTEALDPVHPAYDYFADRERRTVTMALSANQAIPEGANVGHVLQAGFSIIDDLQLRWLRTLGQNPNTTWASYEDMLMPLLLWDGYR